MTESDGPRAVSAGAVRGGRIDAEQGGVDPEVTRAVSSRVSRRAAWVRGIVPTLLAGVLAIGVVATWRSSAAPPAAPPPLAAPGGSSSSRAGLDTFIASMDLRLASHPNDAPAAARLADALLRQARVTNNAGLAIRAEDVLKTALAHEPEHYEALRAMGAVLLSQHRFREAIDAAMRAQRIDPADAWNDGVIGDAHLELGEYDEAFAAFERMMRRRPSAAAYARASYARELQGDLDGALGLMRMAADATSASDPEGQAWHYAQVGDLLFQRGAIAAARTEYARAEFTFPGHPFAAIGLARVKAAGRDYAGALADYQALMTRAPSAFLAARIGELQARLGQPEQAARAYALAEEGWRHDTPEPTLLAAFLAAHAVRTPGASTVPDERDALAVAERAASTRRDIFTMDALAWARFQAGRLDEAREASDQARRTGTRDRVILYHAAAIAEATGRVSAARALVTQALDGHATFDLVAAPEAEALRARLASPSPLADRAVRQLAARGQDAR